MDEPEVLFLFKSSRRGRLGEAGPKEFFYGFTEMTAAGIRAGFAEEGDFPAAWADGPLERLATGLLNPLAALNAATLARLSSRAALSRLNAASAIVATTNAQGLALGALKAAGCLTSPVLFLPMGVWPQDASTWRARVLGRWLRQLSLAPIGRPEAELLQKRLPTGVNLSYLPFGIDTQFWTPGPEGDVGDYALSIGNDRHRDWATMAGAWRTGLPLLKLVTCHSVPPSIGRIETIRGDWNSRPLSDGQIRELYRKARFVVLPLRNTLQPSGQSACLQAMACGKSVILSAIDGLWEPEMLINDLNCLLVPPGKPEAMAAAAFTLTQDPALTRRLGQAAREMVLRHFTVSRMGRVMAARLKEMIAAGAQPDGPNRKTGHSP